ncbi:YggS family pyridoxal phosphate-dependent enzyme [Sediminibacterium soli]|uniref:YggS family pyridoxal phosphate-dependent enzyme n=1 Tax=Sediminibacterium soli TaxID=2698829 RepID=UPI00137B3A70|nr:YggS family pyridoxal phosphate-dependent enzyme [Sediminibacterium soli]NCI46358.1 YggS family pyridoxal phosphate-dependent enzyme [Sediminibacterium soli]
MSVNVEAYHRIKEELAAGHVQLVAVSKTKPEADIRELYELGQRDFGENYVQELVEKEPVLPKDIRWHCIGHLQSNKVKYIAPFVHLVHGVDSWKLLKEIGRQGDKCNRVIDCLLQVHIAREETKFGMSEEELGEVMEKLPSLGNVRVRGMMGMASFTVDESRVKEEFSFLKKLYDRFAEHPSVNPDWNILSMGMSADYQLAIFEGSTMVRVGSLLFGARE